MKMIRVSCKDLLGHVSIFICLEPRTLVFLARQYVSGAWEVHKTRQR